MRARRVAPAGYPGGFRRFRSAAEAV